MQNQELSRVPVVVEATWSQEPDIEQLRSRVSSRLAELALLDHEELDFETDLSAA